MLDYSSVKIDLTTMITNWGPLSLYKKLSFRDIDMNREAHTKKINWYIQHVNMMI